MVDQQKTSSLPFYGNKLVKTPNLQSFAKDGTIFSNAYTSCPLCVPARVSLFTSQFPSVHGSVNNDFLFNNYKHNLLYKLKSEGYSIGLSGKNHCFTKEALKLFDYYKSCSHYGPDNLNISNNQKKSKQFLINSNAIKGAWGSTLNPYSPESLGAYWVTENAIKFINKTKNNFFLWYSIPDPHIPFQVCEPYFSMYPISKIKLPPFRNNEFVNKPYAQYIDYKVMRGDLIKNKDIRKIHSIYYGMNTFIDNQIGRFLSYLKKENLYDNSIIIYVSDHGEYLGEHKMIRKSKSAYDCLIHIPLIVKLIKKNQIIICNDLVSIEDIYPTICDELNIQPDYDIQGLSFHKACYEKNNSSKSFIYGEYGAHNSPYDREKKFYICESPFSDDFRPHFKKGGFGKMRYVRTKRWKLVNYVDDLNELYDLENDPHELINLYYKKDYAAIIKDLNHQLINQMTIISQPEKFHSTIS